MSSENAQTKKVAEAPKPQNEAKKSAPVDKSAAKHQGQDRPRPRRDEREPRDEKDRRGPRNPAARRDGPPRSREDGTGAKQGAPAAANRATVQVKNMQTTSTWNKKTGLSFADMVRQQRGAKASPAAAAAATEQKAAPSAQRATEAPHDDREAAPAEAPARPAAVAQPATAPAAPVVEAVVAPPAPAVAPSAPVAAAAAAPAPAPVAAAAPAPAPASAAYYVLEMDRLDQPVQLPPHVIKAAGMNMSVYTFSATPGKAPQAPPLPQQSMPMSSQQPQAIYSQNAANLSMAQRWMSAQSSATEPRAFSGQQQWSHEALLSNQWPSSAGGDRGLPASRFAMPYGGGSAFEIQQNAVAGGGAMGYRAGRPAAGDAGSMRQMQSQAQSLKPASYMREAFPSNNGVW